MTEKAKRFNTGKVDLTLIPWDAEIQEALVWMMGEEKYGRNNWEKLWGDDTMDVCLASAMRHINYMKQGEMIDQESGLPHAAHVRCNMAMIIRYLGEQDDDSN